MDYEGLTVTLRSEQDRGDYVIRKLEVMNDRTTNDHTRPYKS